MRDRAIVNVAFGDYYRELQVRSLSATLHHDSTSAPMFFDDIPHGCPPHHESMYAFKIHAIREAIRRGHRYILWMDATFKPVASLEPLWEEIARTGWHIAPQGNSMLWEWCSDRALEEMRITRDEARKIQLVYSGLVGLDLYHVAGRAIWAMWEDLYRGAAFNGPHINRPNEPMVPCGQKWAGHASHDPMVKGHRHDEAALSFVLWRLGIEPVGRGFLRLESPNGIIKRTWE